MSAAAGAPPPPPPPPPHRGSSFNDLPAELLLMIYEYIGLGNFMNLALAIYPTLLRHGLVPHLTVETLIRIRHEWQDVDNIPNGQTAVSRMPTELWLQIAGYLEPVDTFALVLGVGNRFYRFKDQSTMQTIMRLCIWSSRSKKK